MMLSDVNYDLLSILQNKLDAIAVYDQYIEDAHDAGDTACERLFTDIKQSDEQHAERLQQTLEQIVKDGKFH